jgi:hypothetical protein
MIRSGSNSELPGLGQPAAAATAGGLAGLLAGVWSSAGNYLFGCYRSSRSLDEMLYEYTPLVGAQGGGGSNGGGGGGGGGGSSNGGGGGDRAPELRPPSPRAGCAEPNHSAAGAVDAAAVAAADAATSAIAAVDWAQPPPEAQLDALLRAASSAAAIVAPAERRRGHRGSSAVEQELRGWSPGMGEDEMAALLERSVREPAPAVCVPSERRAQLENGRSSGGGGSGGGGGAQEGPCGEPLSATFVSEFTNLYVM